MDVHFILPVFYHARRLNRTSLVAHMAALLFSAICYSATFFLLGDSGSDTQAITSGPSKAVEIVKVVLWYLPIAVEITTHFVALSLSGFVKYSWASIEQRAGTVFLIMYVCF